MRITVLTENTCSSNKYTAEHGLSLYIETEKHNILFDMGQTELFAKNAKALGINLKDVDIAVLSHGHYDHGGGLLKFLDINSCSSVYLSKHCFGKYYNGTEKYIGLDPALLESDRLIFTDDIYKIDNGITLFSCNDKVKKYDLGSFGLNCCKNNEFVPDDFCHEQYLLIEEKGKRYLISGCSHKGILNIAQWFDADVLVGGFHFSKLPLDDTLMEYAKYLDDFSTEFYTCHCTGTEQFEFMKKYMNKLFYISTGDIIDT